VYNFRGQTCQFKVEDYVLYTRSLKKVAAAAAAVHNKIYATPAWFFSIKVFHIHVQNVCDYCEKGYILL
jgi:hypothetical protein